jgi:TonB-dependent receptor
MSYTVLLYGQHVGTITGTVVDATTREGLPAANVRIDGTALGTATDAEGRFRIPNIPPGSFTIIISYIGYETQRLPVSIAAGSTVNLLIRMKPSIIEGEEVVVTALLEGQQRAINQQLTSNTIVNVVSSDRIRELPDQNAAESLGRLPGISVERSGGEGQKVIVRGLSPKFNSITVNGERLPATEGNDRSVDLSAISPDVIAGIEVFKALTPDKDGDAVGGTVNLVVRKAPEGMRTDLRWQYGFNNQEREFGQYRGSISASDRFFDHALGVMVTGSIQRATRSSDLLTADYVFKSDNQGVGMLEIDNLNLADRLERRDRWGVSLAVDKDLLGGNVLLSTFLSRTDRKEITRRKRYRVGSFTVEYDIRDREVATVLLSNTLSGKHQWGVFEFDWQGSYSRSKQLQPFSHYARFQEVGGFKDGLVDDQGPTVIPQYARNDLSSTWFQYATFNPASTLDADLTGQLNVKIPFRLVDYVAGFVKVGAKHRDKNRERDVTEYRTPFGEVGRIGRENPGKYTMYRNTEILIENFLDRSFKAERFLNGQYDFPVGLHKDLLSDFYATYRSRYMLNRFLELEDYTAGEGITGAYFMSEINIGEKLMILPGIRYERTKNDYRGNFGQLQGNLGENGAIRDTVGGQSYEEWLPMVHLRYKIVPGLDVRLAFTRTLSRPDYFNLVPFVRINYAEQIYDRGNPHIKHTKARNYDVFLSTYNEYGLATLGGFYKTLDDIDYIKTIRLVGGEFNAFTLTEPTNGARSKVYGFEIDLQTNFRFLPSPFDGIVLNANYSRIWSETFFPYFEIVRRPPTFRATPLDTVRAGRVPGQADHIANVSLGYEKGGFTGRISMVYQGASLRTVGQRSELDGYSNASYRWDLTVSQKIYKGTGLFLNVNNLSNQPEDAYLGRVSYPTREEFFGWTADLGFRYTF